MIAMAVGHHRLTITDHDRLTMTAMTIDHDRPWTIDRSPSPMDRRRSMNSLHSVVPRALTELFRHGPMSQGKLEVAWRVAVGDAICRVTTVRLQPDGVVQVQTA